MFNRCIDRKERGLIGLGPSLAREGEDFIALCEGAITALVVRRKGSIWAVVGDRCVHGIMKGENWEFVKVGLKTMWFVSMLIGICVLLYIYFGFPFPHLVVFP